MDLLKLHFFIVIILIICLSQENFVNSIGEEGKIEKKENTNRKFYAYCTLIILIYIPMSKISVLLILCTSNISNIKTICTHLLQFCKICS